MQRYATGRARRKQLLDHHGGDRVELDRSRPPSRCCCLTQKGYTAIRPQPQRPPPPVQTKLAMAGPAEFVTCDQTIERTIGRLKQFRQVATRYEKREANYLAMVQIAAIVLLWLD